MTPGERGVDWGFPTGVAITRAPVRKEAQVMAECRLGERQGGCCIPRVLDPSKTTCQRQVQVQGNANDRSMCLACVRACVYISVVGERDPHLAGAWGAGWGLGQGNDNNTRERICIITKCNVSEYGIQPRSDRMSSRWLAAWGTTTIPVEKSHAVYIDCNEKRSKSSSGSGYRRRRCPW